MFLCQKMMELLQHVRRGTMWDSENKGNPYNEALNTVSRLIHEFVRLLGSHATSRTGADHP